MKRKLHRVFGYFGFIWNGHYDCLRHGCGDYCGKSPSEAFMFILAKSNGK